VVPESSIDEIKDSVFGLSQLLSVEERKCQKKVQRETSPNK
jgi:hypothetical protein